MPAAASLWDFRYVRGLSSYRQKLLIVVIGRNKSYLTLSIVFTKDIGKARHLISWFPHFLRGFVAKTLTSVNSRIEECRELIEPTVLERTVLMEKLGAEWDDKPVRCKGY